MMSSLGQKVTKGDRGEGGGHAYLVGPDDIISGRPLIHKIRILIFFSGLLIVVLLYV